MSCARVICVWFFLITHEVNLSQYKRTGLKCLLSGKASSQRQILAVLSWYEENKSACFFDCQVLNTVAFLSPCLPKAKVKFLFAPFFSQPPIPPNICKNRLS